MFCFVASGNRSAALAQYADCERALHDELGVQPSQETRALYDWIRTASSESGTLAARLTNLPIPATSFIGRQRERADIKQQLATTRMLTLTGAGGSGKTRLSIQVGTELLDTFRDGVWWIELAPLAEGAHIVPQLARALGIREQATQPLLETVRDVLQTRALLLILDNCEHVIDDAAYIADALLQTCAHLKLLATSREPLNIPGEVTLPLATLNMPRADIASVTALLMEFDAVRLFVERAQAALPPFALTTENAEAVLQICRRLDGIPLALELAAARVRGMSVQQIASKLNDRFSLLTQGSRIAPPRQQTLRALIDWSYELLTENERVLFARASVFAGSWTLDAIEEIAADDLLPRDNILNVLQRLVERSLVIADTTQAEARYTMLETIREYAHTRAVEMNQLTEMRARHLEYFCAWIKRVHPNLWGPTTIEWTKRVEVEHDNLRAAFEYAHDAGNLDRGLELAIRMARFWTLSNYFREGQETLSGLVAHIPEPAAPIHAQALSALGHMEFRRSRYTQAIAAATPALSCAQAHGDEKTQAESLRTLGLAHYALKRYDRAEELLNEASVLYGALGDHYEQAVVVNDLGDVARTVGDFKQAEKYYRETLAYVESIGDRRGTVIVLSNVALALSAQKEYQAALEILARTTPLFLELGERHMLVYVLSEIAFILSRTGKILQAVRLFGATEALRQKLDYLLLGDDHTLYQARLVEMQQLVPAQNYAREWILGQSYSLEQAIALALKSA